MAKAHLTKAAIEAIEVPAGLRYVDTFDTVTPGLFVRKYESGRVTWYVRYYVRRKRSTFKIGDASLLTPSLARREARRVLTEATQGVDAQGERKAERAEALTFDAYLREHYGPWVMENRKAGENTLKRLRSVWKGLLRRPLGEITQIDIERIRTAKVKAAGRPDAGNREVAVLRAALNKAVDWGLIERSPAERVKLNRADRRAPKRVLTEAEIARLLQVLRDRDAEMRAARARANAWRRAREYAELPDLHFGDHMTPLIVLLLNTGMRRGEAFSLEWRDVALDMETVTVRGEVAKSGQSRTIPLNGQALAALRAWKAQPSADGDPSPYVFPGATGGRLDNVNKAWRAVCKAAGLEGLGLHSLRHTFCSQLAAAGIPVTDIQALAGHASITTTSIYMRSSEPARRRAIEALDRIMGGGEVVPFPAADAEA